MGRNWNSGKMLVEMLNSTSTIGNTMAVAQKIKLPYNPAVPLLGKYPKEVKSESQRETLPRSLQHY
jgi:hypothetical protein